MKRKSPPYIIGTIINIIIVSRYFWDKLTIRCEPCLEWVECPPCQTYYMETFWWYFIGCNLFILLAWLISGKREENNNSKGNVNT